MCSVYTYIYLDLITNNNVYIYYVIHYIIIFNIVYYTVHYMYSIIYSRNITLNN